MRNITLLFLAVITAALAEEQPDGSSSGRIAFCSDRDGNWEIFVMDADGSNQIQLTDNESDDRSPAWCPVE
jgi:Tol biopolymer transport system component